MLFNCCLAYLPLLGSREILGVGRVKEDADVAVAPHQVISPNLLLPEGEFIGFLHNALLEAV